MSKIATMQTLSVEKDLSGGVRIKIGDRAVVLSPQQAVDYARGVLKAAGLDTQITNRAEQFLHPTAIRLQQ